MFQISKDYKQPVGNFNGKKKKSLRNIKFCLAITLYHNVNEKSIIIQKKQSEIKKQETGVKTLDFF